MVEDLLEGARAEALARAGRLDARRIGGRWVVREAGNYPADLGKLRINGEARVAGKAVKVANGYVLVIDKVLLP